MKLRTVLVRGGNQLQQQRVFARGFFHQQFRGLGGVPPKPPIDGEEDNDGERSTDNTEKRDATLEKWDKLVQHQAREAKRVIEEMERGPRGASNNNKEEDQKESDIPDDQKAKQAINQLLNQLKQNEKLDRKIQGKLSRKLKELEDIQRQKPDGGDGKRPKIGIGFDLSGWPKKQTRDNKEGKDKKGDQKHFEPPGGNSLLDAAMGLAVVLWLMTKFMGNAEPGEEITMQDFFRDYLATGRASSLLVIDQEIVRVGNALHSPYFRIGSAAYFEKALADAQKMLGRPKDAWIPVTYKARNDTLGMLANAVMPTVIFFYVITRLLRGGVSGARGGGMPGADIFNFGKSKHKMFQKQEANVTFKDVAGVGEAKQEILEFVQFLKDPSQFTKLGAKSPKGALLVGPPGTGKTLIAKATAGEANVPFFSVSGSDFIEMYVGVGPSRVRSLFEQARENKPCIIFIDEIDAVGRARGRGGMRTGGNDERENTLNALLVEMDGMDDRDGVLVIAGTNRADVLDKALMRSGRFDRQIAIDLPDIASRREILLVHMKPLKLAKPAEEYVNRLAALTPGFSGASLANICNEAALIAARYDAPAVDWKQFEAAIDRVIAGMERKTRVLSQEEKNVVAHHEAGHAVAGWFLKHVDPLLKVSIVPRGASTLGFAQYQPHDQHLHTLPELEDRICMALGGRVAEQLCFGRITTGASDDLSRVTNIAYSQIASYGMSDELGPLSYPMPSGDDMTIGKPYSEETAELIDDHVQAMVKRCYERTESLLEEHMDGLLEVASELKKLEVISREQVEKILGPRPFGEFNYDDAIERANENMAKKQ